MLTQNGLHPLLNGLLLNMLYLNLNIKSIFFFLISGQTMSVSSFKKLEPEEYLRQHYQQGLRPDGRKGLTSLRPVSISVGSISVADGSAVVKQGDTIVVSMVFIVTLTLSSTGQGTFHLEFLSNHILSAEFFSKLSKLFWR